MGELLRAMQAEQRPATQTMPLAQRLGTEKSVLLAYWLERLKDLPVSHDKPLQQRLTMRQDDSLALDLSDCKISDLSQLKEMPLGALDCSGCNLLAGLEPLIGRDTD